MTLFSVVSQLAIFGIDLNPFPTPYAHSVKSAACWIALLVKERSSVCFSSNFLAPEIILRMRSKGFKVSDSKMKSRSSGAGMNAFDPGKVTTASGDVPCSGQSRALISSFVAQSAMSLMVGVMMLQSVMAV